MGFGLYSTPVDSFLSYIPFKGKDRPEQTKLFPAKLPAVLATFGSSENLIVDSVQCQPARSPTAQAIHCKESNLSRISSQKRIFKQKHFIRGPDGFVS